jgi:hypothetical protein
LTDLRQQIGFRIDLALQIARINVDRFCSKHNIPRSTLFAWKRGIQSLTVKGAERLVKAFEHENLICTTNWFLEGTGLPPRTLKEVEQGALPVLGYYKTEQDFDETLDEEIKLLREIEFFRQMYANSRVLLVTDDGMMPIIKPGDYVAGLTVAKDQIDTTLNQICLIELSSDQIFLRHLSKGSGPECYILSCLNPRTSVESPTLFNVKIKSVAPLVWIRYKNNSETENL